MDLSQATWDSAIHAMGVSAVSIGTDARLHVRFFTQPEHQEAQSRIDGVPVYINRDMIEVRQPGERDAIVRHVHNGDLRRFPAQWQAYREHREQVQDGVPLSILFPDDPAVVAMMKGIRIYTIEALAGASEAAIARMHVGGRAWVNKAQQYMDAIAGGSGVLKLQAQAVELQAQNADLARQLRDMQDRMARMESAPPRPRGRPRKEEIAEEGGDE
jgi:hypothetical protein